jgi:hypothetical protein
VEFVPHKGELRNAYQILVRKLEAKNHFEGSFGSICYPECVRTIKHIKLGQLTDGWLIGKEESLCFKMTEDIAQLGESSV